MQLVVNESWNPSFIYYTLGSSVESVDGSALFISNYNRVNFTAHKCMAAESCISPYKLNYKSVLARNKSRIQAVAGTVANVFSAESAYIDSNRLYTSLTLLLNL